MGAVEEPIKEVTDILTEKKDILEYFAEELLKKEELEYDDIQEMFGKFGLRSFSKSKPSRCANI